MCYKGRLRDREPYNLRQRKKIGKIICGRSTKWLNREPYNLRERKQQSVNDKNIFYCNNVKKVKTESDKVFQDVKIEAVENGISKKGARAPPPQQQRDLKTALVNNDHLKWSAITRSCHVKLTRCDSDDKQSMKHAVKKEKESDESQENVVDVGCSLKYEIPSALHAVKLEATENANHLKTLNSLKLWGTRYRLVNKAPANFSKTFPCELCGKTFRRKGLMTQHLMRHIGEKPYRCSVCSKEFMSKWSVTVHMRKHTRERPYRCDACGKCFMQSSHLLHHKRRHTGQRPYQCGVCGKRFVQQSSLNQHERLHTGERPYQCFTCGQRFIQKEGLDRHMVSHFELPYSCLNCNKSFPYPSLLRIHVDEVACKRHDDKVKVVTTRNPVVTFEITTEKAEEISD